ncbi:hypothetical protein N7455_001678 [Penicillium solitum]|uniref:uncharacterized protein n=1 Tax=Penicillium solitum TaxID=60172 RepID=UPI0032C478C0|nr:hypothetical protein N7536_005830 [Penicillium majusculum]KAJ5878213.1 hypothetical protein N7455_001678 [Penicillium solitum]
MKFTVLARNIGIIYSRSVIPKSKLAERIKQNFDITFELEPIDIENINTIDKKLRFNDPSKDFGYELYSGLNRKKK